MANTFVVICTRNRPEPLASILEDLGKQTRRIRLVLVVDSSDSPLSSEYFRSFQSRQIDEIIYLHSRAGLPYQRNVALNYLNQFWSAADTVHFLDDDVRIDPNFISVAKSLVCAYPEASVIGAWDRGLVLSKSNLLRRIALLGDFRNQGKLLRSGCAFPPIRPSEVQVVDWCPGFSLNFSVKHLLGFWFGGRYRMYGEDLEACLRLRDLGPILVSPELSLNHHQNEVGRDQSRAITYFSDVFRWRLSRLAPKHVAGISVIWSTFALLAGELLLAIKRNSRSGVQNALGHAQFFFDLVTNRLKEQEVEHDYLDLKPKFVFSVPMSR